MSGIYEHLVPKDLDPVPVHVYDHPDWDMQLILLADERSRGHAEDLLGDAYECKGGRGDVCWHGEPTRHNDPAQLTKRETTMPREEFVNLSEWDG